MKKPRTPQALTEQNTPALSKEPSSTCDGGLIPSPSSNSQAPMGRKTIAQGKEPSTAALDSPPSSNSHALTGRKTIAQGKEPSDAALDSPHSSNSQALTGRTIPAQGKESRDAALDSPPPQNPSPVGAAQTTLGEISTIRTGKLDANAQNIDGKFPFFTCGDEALRINTAAFDAEAVLLAGNGNFGVKYYKGKFNAYQRTYVIEPSQISGKWLFYLVSHHIAKITKGCRGSTIQYLRIGDISDCSIELPPLAEQHRIVAKIEELFS